MVDADYILNLTEKVNKLLHLSGEEETKEISTTNSLKDKLMAKYEDYDQPKFTQATWDQYRRLQITEAKAQIAATKARCLALNTPYVPTQKDEWSLKDKFTVQESNITYCFDFTKMEYDKIHPMRYQFKILLEDFKTAVEYYGETSDFVSLPGSLMGILNLSQTKGLDLLQLNELLFLFIQKHHSSLLGPATQYMKSGDCRSMFQSLVNAVDPALDKARVEKAKAAVCRKVGDQISDTMTKVKSLCFQLLTILTDLSVEKREEKAGQVAMTDLKRFVTPPLYRKYKEWSYGRIAAGLTLTFEDSVRKIQSLETENPAWRITTTMCGEAAPVDPQFLAAAEVNHMQTFSRDQGGRRDERSWSAEKGGRSGGQNWATGRRDSQERGRFSRSRGRGRPNDRRGRPQQRPQGYQFKSRQKNFQSRGRAGGSRSESRSGGWRDGSLNRRSSGDFSKSRSGSNQSVRAENQSKFYRSTREARQSPQSARKFRSRSMEGLKDPFALGLCVRCGSDNHNGNSCFRYNFFKPSSNFEKPYCTICAKTRFIKLLHRDKDCRFSKNSNYRSPSQGTREARMRSFQTDRKYSQAQKNF